MKYYRLGAGPNGIEDIKKHEFFASIDWDGLLKKEVIFTNSFPTDLLHKEYSMILILTHLVFLLLTLSTHINETL